MVQKFRTAGLVMLMALSVAAPLAPVFEKLASPPVAYAQAESEPSQSAQQAPQNSDTTINQATNDDATEVVDFSGNCRQQVGILSWILCPVLNMVAEGVEQMATWIIENFLYTEPIITSAVDQDARSRFLYEAWSSFRNIANVLLVGAFLIIIYLQLTNNNYQVQKTLPRLVVTAVLIQLSFFIAAFIIDVGNVIAAGINGIFSSVNATLPGIEEVRNNYIEQSSIAETLVDDNMWLGNVLGLSILIAMAPIAAPAIFSFLTGGGLVFLVLTLGVSILLFFVLLALRQLAIVAFVVLAPIAFLTAVFPRTDKWAKEWFDNFVKIILIYPVVILIVSIASTLSLISIASSVEGFGQFLAALLPIIAFLGSPFAFKFAGRLFGNLVGVLQQGTRRAQGGILGSEQNPHSTRNRLRGERAARSIRASRAIGSTPGLGYTTRFTRPSHKQHRPYGEAENKIKTLFNPIFPENMRRFVWGEKGFESMHGTQDWGGMEGQANRNFKREFGSLYKAGFYYPSLFQTAAQDIGGPDKVLNYAYGNAYNAASGTVYKGDGEEFHKGFTKSVKGSHLYMDAMEWNDTLAAVQHPTIGSAKDLGKTMFSSGLSTIEDPKLQNIAIKSRKKYLEGASGTFDDRQSGASFGIMAEMLSDPETLSVFAQDEKSIDELRSLNAKAATMSATLEERLSPADLERYKEGLGDDETLVVGGYGRTGYDIRKQQQFLNAMQSDGVRRIIGRNTDG